METPEWTRENVEKLAERIIAGWELEDLILFAREIIAKTLNQDREGFADEWERIERE